MINETDQELVSKVTALLGEGLTVNSAAKRLGFNCSNTLYQRLYRLGYRIENRSRLVPIHAQPIDTTTAASAAAQS